MLYLVESGVVDVGPLEQVVHVEERGQRLAQRHYLALVVVVLVLAPTAVRGPRQHLQKDKSETMSDIISHLPPAGCVSPAAMCKPETSTREAVRTTLRLALNHEQIDGRTPGKVVYGCLNPSLQP